MKVALTIAFIAAVGAGAVVMARRPTKLSGAVIADDLLAQLKEKGITEMTCADSVIGKQGAEFLCQVGATDGSHATIRYTMARSGQIKGEQVEDHR
ncbi:MAG TPA: hypothetical protein VGM90_16475 [Kofleriaceae bacterium]|jgi:hypothetical protein